MTFLIYIIIKGNGRRGNLKSDLSLFWPVRNRGKLLGYRFGYTAKSKEQPRLMGTTITLLLRLIMIYSSLNFCRRCERFSNDYLGLVDTGQVSELSNSKTQRRRSFGQRGPMTQCGGESFCGLRKVRAVLKVRRPEPLF